MAMQPHAVPRTASPWKRKKPAAEYMGCSVRHLDYLIAAGDIPVSRSGRVVLIHVDDIDSYLRRNRSVA